MEQLTDNYQRNALHWACTIGNIQAANMLGSLTPMLHDTVRRPAHLPNLSQHILHSFSLTHSLTLCSPISSIGRSVRPCTVQSSFRTNG